MTTKHSSKSRRPRWWWPASSAVRAALVAGIAAVIVVIVLVVALLPSSTVSKPHKQGPPVSLPPAARAVPLLGTSISNPAQLAQNTSEYGHLPIIRYDYKNLPASDAWTTGVPGRSKTAVIVSFNALPSAILSGRDNGVLRHFFDTAPHGEPIFYSYIHEPESHVVKGEFTAAAYRKAWAHVVVLADEAHNRYLHSILIMTTFDLTSTAHLPWKEFLPGGKVISTLGWDAYPGQGVARPPQEFMGPAIAASRSAGLPFGFSEFGLSTVPHRTAWVAEVGRYVMKSGALFASLFDSQFVYPSFAIHQPATIAVWRAYIRASSAGKRSVQLPADHA